MRFGLAVLSMVAALLMVAFLAVDHSSTVIAQETVTVNLGPGQGPAGGGDQTGTATLTAQGDQTQVVLDIEPGPAAVEQPAHIHEGSCPGVGEVAFPLTNVVNGTSTTVVDASLEELQSGDFAINIHKSGDEIGVYVACGDILAAAAPAAQPPTGGPPPTDEGGFAWWYVLIATGALALMGGGALALRLRQR